MCLIAFAYNMHPEYKLVLMANRDEFYKRPTRAAQFWNNEHKPDLLAGKDLEGGGTWMGVTKTGKWAALTNYRDPNWTRDNPPTRGNIALNYLTDSYSPEQYLNELQKTALQYEGFNVLVGDKENLFHYSNANDKITKLEPGIHGVSNAVLNTSWPKLKFAKDELSNAVNRDNLNKELLFKVLKNDQQAAEKAIPNTGIPHELEKAISPVFIQTENYGTRCSTLIFINRNGSVSFTERRFSEKGEPFEENTFEL